MARAICTQCGNEFHWHGGRGCKLVDIVSPCCHMPAKGKSGNRTPKTPSNPSVMAHAKTDRYMRGIWRASKTRIELLPTGNIQTSWGFLGRAVLGPTDEIENGWRLFEGAFATRCMLREDDWIKLQAKPRKD